MSCELFDRDDYEVRVAQYLRSFGDEEGVAVYIRHVPIGTEGGPMGTEKEILAMAITVGSAGGDYIENGSNVDSAEVLERHLSEDGEGVDEVRQLPGGVVALVHVNLKEQRPFILFPFFTISLDAWSMEQDPEQALGPSFKEALRLLLRSYEEAFYAYYGDGLAQSRTSVEADERLEAGAQPQMVVPTHGLDSDVVS